MNRRLFAIGDIHGMYSELTSILDWIEAQAHAAEIVFLGDLIDRGEYSREVLELVKKGPWREQDKWVCIKGNHEDLCVQGREGVSGMLECWLNNGGAETIQSYDGNYPPDDHVEWMKNLPVYHETENHWFVHAGMFPGFHPSNHSPELLMWVRNWENDVLESGYDGPGYEKHVVFGHTPHAEVLQLPHCTNLDTGACFGRKLTAAEFDRDSGTGPIRIIQVDVKTGVRTVR